MSRAIVAVTFDAAGTLFAVREPVGDTYARHARRLGFAVTAAAMESGFRAAFAAAPPLAAPPHAVRDPAARLAFERAWWRDVVAGALASALGDAGAAGRRAAPIEARATADPPPGGAAAEQLFADLFAHYARGDAWRVADGAHDALDALARRGLRLGVLSNFDGRLHAIVRALGLDTHLVAVIASSEVGAAKPSRDAFAAAARALGGPPPEASLHVGDSIGEDVLGAVAAGWRGAWLAGPSPPGGAAHGAHAPPSPGAAAHGAPALPDGVPRLAALREVVDLVDASAA